MKRNILMICMILCAVLLLNSCGGSSADEVSKSDAAEVSSEVSSAIQVTAENAVTVNVGEQKLEDCFLLKSMWDGEEFENKSSLNRLMIEKYMSEDSIVPKAADKSIIRFAFAGNDKPVSVKLTQQANTFVANTGIPYKIEEIELQQDESGEYYFEIDFASFTMYYYQLDCEWSNGNWAQYVFALEKDKD